MCPIHSFAAANEWVGSQKFLANFRVPHARGGCHSPLGTWETSPTRRHDRVPHISILRCGIAISHMSPSHPERVGVSGRVEGPAFAFRKPTTTHLCPIHSFAAANEWVGSQNPSPTFLPPPVGRGFIPGNHPPHFSRKTIRAAQLRISPPRPAAAGPIQSPE
jgi:hypothetical protein